jgi:hypothetical protein
MTERHRTRTRDEYRTIFGVEPTVETGREHLDLIFERVIQARATPLPADRYRELAEQDVLREVLRQPSHDAAFQRGCHRTVLMAIDGFSVTGSKPAVCDSIETTVATSNNAN